MQLGNISLCLSSGRWVLGHRTFADGLMGWSYEVIQYVPQWGTFQKIHSSTLETIWWYLVKLCEADVFVVSTVAVDRTLRGWVTRWWKAAWELTVMLLILLFRNLTKLRWAARLAHVCFYFGLGWMMSSCMIKEYQRHSCQSSPIIAKAVGPQWASCLVTRCLRQAATWHA